ncbi:MAG: hypothetical protein PHS37_09035 [Candidatus Omnitrophica bacterium]|nr:hypothetical protein [Candidatus Omnitrophota bacterium]
MVNSEKNIAGFVEELKRAYAADLVSVILHGSALEDAFSKKHSDINLLVVLTNTAMESLSRIKPVLNRRAYQNISVIFFTEGFIRGSGDVFSIEFIEMKERYKVLWGKDVLKDLTLDVRNLRFQTELELRSLLVKARRFYLANLNRGLLRQALFKFNTSAVYLVKSLRRFADVAVPDDTLTKIRDAKKNNTPMTYPEAEKLYFAFVGSLEKIIEVVDKI